MMLPAVFVSHGAPTLPFDDVPARDFLRGLGQSLGRPRAILVMSAHWETEAPSTNAVTVNDTIHDFGGFPRQLYELHYPAPGDVALAAQVAALTGGAVDTARGLDHGAWVPALLGWPEADIPIFQLSVQPDQSPAHHIALGRKLAPLRDEGVLVMGSGSATHNLRALVRHGTSPEPEPWAKAFDDWLADAVARGDEPALAEYRTRAPYAAENHPSDEHLLPLHVAFGAAGEGARGRSLHRSFTLGNLSMASYAFG